HRERHRRERRGGREALHRCERDDPVGLPSLPVLSLARSQTPPNDRRVSRRSNLRVERSWAMHHFWVVGCQCASTWCILPTRAASPRLFWAERGVFTPRTYGIFLAF